MGVALRVLLENRTTLSRNEFVGLVNTMNKWVESIVILQNMKDKQTGRTQEEIIYLSVLFLFVVLGIGYFLNFLNFLDSKESFN